MAPKNLCSRCQTSLELDDLRCPVCFLAVPSQQVLPAETLVQILRCESCGSAITYDAKLEQPRCAFCGSACQLEEPQDPIEQAEAFVPFAIEPGEAQQRLRKWMSGLGFFRPKDLAHEATVESLKALWWAAWSVDAEASVSWAADSNAGAKNSSWAPHAGVMDLQLDDFLVSASHGLNDDEVRQLRDHYDQAVAELAAQGPATAQVERFDFQRSAARQFVLDALRAHASDMLKAHVIPGSRFRKLGLSIVLQGLRTRRLGLPAFVLAYRYRKRLYRVVINGQNPANIVGSAPLSWGKIALTLFGGLLLVLLLLWLNRGLG